MENNIRRFLGLDYGGRTVGVAVSDPLGLTAQPVETIWRDRENHLRETLRRIGELAAQYQVSGIVLGLPLNMDGSAGERAEKTMEFRDVLERRTGLPVYLSDERLSTVESEEVLSEMGIKKRDMKRLVDRTAAAIILTDWLREHEDDIFYGQ